MKKLLKVALVAVGLMMVGNFAKAQVKIGYINTNELMGLLPEMKTLQVQMQAYQKTFADQYQTMTTEYQTKGQAYESQQATMTDAARTAAQAELQDMQARIKSFTDNAQKQVDAKSQELLKPLQDKVRAAITQAAKDKGYTYVLDAGTTDLLVSPPADNLLPAVKAILGLQ